MFRQLTRKKWTDGMLLNFPVSSKRFTGGFLKLFPYFSFFFFFKSTAVCHTMHLLLLWHFLKLEEQIHSFTSVLQQSITCQ